jgi:hypothetical protein
MANLSVTDAVALGNFIRRVATDDAERQQLVAKADAFEDFKPFLIPASVPAGHKIRVIEEMPNTTTVVLAAKEDFPQAGQVPPGFRYPPAEHNAHDTSQIAVSDQQGLLDAYSFMIGEYILKHCK